MKTRWESDQDLCDTASGDTDDVCSLCSWTTDQGDFSDSERRSVAGTVDTRPHSLSSASYGVASSCSDGVMNGASVTPYQCGMDGVVPLCMDSCQGQSVPMFGYMPSIVPVCYVVMPTMDNALSWPDALLPQMTPDKDVQTPWVQPRAHAPGQWSKPASKRFSGNVQATAVKGRPGAPGGSASAASKSVLRAEPVPAMTPEATTVILRNLPTECTRDMLLQILEDEGFSGAYDFLHLPIDFQTKSALGYAVLNLVTHDAALHIQKHFNGFSKWPCHSGNICEVAWNSPHQGLATHIDRYRNSPLMHVSVPESYRPVLFENGVRVQFPAPTAKIRAPRIRHPKPSTAIQA